MGNPEAMSGERRQKSVLTMARPTHAFSFTLDLKLIAIFKALKLVLMEFNKTVHNVLF